MVLRAQLSWTFPPLGPQSLVTWLLFLPDPQISPSWGCHDLRRQSPAEVQAHQPSQSCRGARGLQQVTKAGLAPGLTGPRGPPGGHTDNYPGRCGQTSEAQCCVPEGSQGGWV